MTTKIADKPARAYRHWSTAELEYLAENYGIIRDKVLAKRLQRSESAMINTASRKRVVARMTNFYTAAALAEILGISCPGQVVQWVKKGWLKGRKSAMSQGKKQLWRFSEYGIVVCLRRRPWLANISVMERHYFHTVVISELQRDPWYTVEQAAYLLGLTKPAAVYRYIHRGWLPAEKKPYRGAQEGQWVIRHSAIQAFLENDPRHRHRHTAASTARKRFIVSSGEPSRLATIWVIKCPSCGQRVTIAAPPQLRGPRVREMFIELYVDGNCKHGADCLISTYPLSESALDALDEEAQSLVE